MAADYRKRASDVHLLMAMILAEMLRDDDRPDEDPGSEASEPKAPDRR
jgi:hypothetical protein